MEVRNGAQPLGNNCKRGLLDPEPSASQGIRMPLSVGPQDPRPHRRDEALPPTRPGFKPRLAESRHLLHLLLNCPHAYHSPTVPIFNMVGCQSPCGQTHLWEAVMA